MTDVWRERVRAVRELGAVGALIVLVLGGAYFLMAELRPKLEAVPRIEAAINSERERSQQHDAETLRVTRLQCRGVRLLAHLDPETCEARGGQP